MSWDGDISKMGDLAQHIATLASVPSRASKRVAEAIEQLILDEFDAGADPYGNAWAPLEEVTLQKRSQTSEPPLTDYGTMRRSLIVRPMSGAGISITIDHPAAPHQTGWSGPRGSGPARPILPSKGMPLAWQEAIETATDEEIRKSVG